MSGDGAGQFTALVSAFNVIDSAGDVVMPGAFTRNLGEWAESGHRIPVVWNHKSDDPFAFVGEVLEARETDAGLEVTGQLDLDDPHATKVHGLLKGRRVRGFSFAYQVKASRPGERDGRRVNELLDLDVYEVGPTLNPCNRAAELLDVKTEPNPAEVAIGWVHSLGAAPQLTPAGLARWLTDMETR
ncbi:MAG: HK97 family phage prohead protease [Pseudonocardiaceae bacterium]